MEKYPTNPENQNNNVGDTTKKIGHTLLSHRDADPWQGELYWENIDPYFENNRERHAKMYGSCLIEDYGHVQHRIGGTFQADRKTAMCIMGPINQMYDQVNIEYDEIEDNDKEFAVKYSDEDNTLYLCYGREFDFNYERGNGKDYYDELQLVGKYEHFYRMAYAIWRVHQHNEPSKYESFSKKELSEEADLFATSILIDGMENEREWWQSQIKTAGSPSPAERLVSIEKLLHKMKS